MFKYLSIFAALAVLATGSANAQQREATFQKIVVSGSNFDIVLAMAKPNSPTVNYANEIDPSILYLGNGLVTAYTRELAEMIDIETLLHPFHTTRAGYGTVLTYIVPKRTASTAAMR